MSKVVDLKGARKASEQRKYRGAVLEVFDQMEHADKRNKREQAAEVRRKARNQY